MMIPLVFRSVFMVVIACFKHPQEAIHTGSSSMYNLQMSFPGKGNTSLKVFTPLHGLGILWPQDNPISSSG